MQTCWFIVIQSRSSWWVDCEGRTFGPLATRDQAVEYARTIAVSHGDPGRRADVWAPDEHGRHRLVWSAPAPSERMDATDHEASPGVYWPRPPHAQ